MKTITYVTGNYGKYVRVKEQFEEANISINYFKCDLDEPEVNDIKYISQEKARQAYEILKTPVFVADTGFYIKEYPNNPGYPGAFVKRSGISSNIDNLLNVMKDVEDRECYFLDCLTYYDGKEFMQFIGVSEGSLSYEKRGNELKKAKSNLWYVFIPKNHNKTLAEMTDYERCNRNDEHVSATDLFIDWYKENFNNKKLIKK